MIFKAFQVQVFVWLFLEVEPEVDLNFRNISICCYF